ncbi:MAG: phosphoenolpyruvate--protein phosphotransferase [Planctomycetota bacterium]
MQTRKGIPVSPGIAITPALVIDAEDQAVPRRCVPTNRTQAEHQRVADALKASVKELEDIRQQTAATLGEELARIFSFHIGMLDDPSLVDQFHAQVDTYQVTAEFAVHTVFQKWVDSFAAHPDPFFRDRGLDIQDLRRRVLRQLIGGGLSAIANLTRPAAVIAHDLTPSQTASLDRSLIKALAIDAGGQTSHTAILAHALGIPAIVGLGDIARRTSTGDNLVIDGDRGLVIINPDAATLLDYRQQARKQRQRAESYRSLRDQPAETRDGTRVTLHANIEFPTEIPPALELGAEGVGLYRTEYVYLASDTAPTEDDQYDTYLAAIKALDGKPLTLRTIDLGADKMPAGIDAILDRTERNPFLGCRSIRLCLQNLELFRTQLRAVLRAAAHGPIKIMFPLISNIMELRQARMILDDVREDLEDQGVPVPDNIPVGMMIEVPSAAIQAHAFAKEADFFSIGTNDLIQYTVAVDRGNEHIASLYSAAHPAVISLIKEVVRVAKRSDTPVSLCGEMASLPEFTMLLLGLGLRSFSITPPAIPLTKQIIRSVSLQQCQRVARRVAGLDSQKDIANTLKEELRKAVPDAVQARNA